MILNQVVRMHCVFGGYLLPAWVVIFLRLGFKLAFIIETEIAFL
jgi:hypothetical protein